MWTGTPAYLLSLPVIRLVGDEVFADRRGRGVPDKPHGAVGDLSDLQLSGRGEGHWEGHTTGTGKAPPGGEPIQINLKPDSVDNDFHLSVKDSFE